MAKTQFLTYYIHLDDAARVAELQQQYPDGVNRAIQHESGGAVDGGAVVEFSPSGTPIPFIGTAIPTGPPPYIYTPWRSDASSDKPFPIDVATFTRKTGGFFGIGGTTTKYYWVGQFVYTGPAQPTDDEGNTITGADLPRRRWIEGFESAPLVARTNSGVGLKCSREASRHFGQFGWAFRGDTDRVSLNPNSYGVEPFQQEDHWDRFYIRLRRVNPGGAICIWRNTGGPTTLASAALFMASDQRLGVYNAPSGGGFDLVATIDTVFELHRWYKLDVLVNPNPNVTGGNGRLRVYINGALAIDQLFPASAGGLGQTSGYYADSYLGNYPQSSNEMEIDFDDWIGAEIPKTGGVEDLTGLDWQHGSKVVPIKATGFAASSTGWTGDWRTLLQLRDTACNDGAQLTSSTSGAIIAVTTDADVVIDAQPGVLGVGAMLIALLSSRGAASGTLGYSLAGGAWTDVAITQTGTSGNPAFNYLLYSPAGLDSVAPFGMLAPLALRHTKGAGADAATVQVLNAQAEVIGTWGPEDLPANAPAQAFPESAGLHNCPYPNSQWAIVGAAPPLSPYIVKAGTYVGTGTYIDVPFRAPVHMFWQRPTTGTGMEGGKWFSSFRTAHGGTDLGHGPAHMVQAVRDRSFVAGSGEEAQQEQYLVRVVGADQQSNAVGVTYQYVAVMDPGARFMENGAFKHKSSANYDADNLLTNPTFTPDFVFLQHEAWSSTITASLYASAVGIASDAVVGGAGSLTIDALTRLAGKLRSRIGYHAVIAGNGVAFSAWRKADGNNDPGQAAVLSCGSYIGSSGALTMTIGTAGLRPLFAVILGSSGEGYMRDPSHTSTNSNQVDGGANSTTGITAGGIDQITVGNTLNSTGVTYVYFVLWGSATAGNNGWSINGEFFPVEADSPADGVWPDVDEDTYADQPVGGTPPAVGVDDFAAACVVASTKIANTALSYIGISKEIGDIVNEQSREAATLRLHFSDAVDATLREFAWPFATRYAALTLVGGTDTVAYNRDWQYAYRAPTNMMRASRLTREGIGRGYDPNPPPFVVGGDDTGELILTDEADAHLEYTVRLACPAASRDPLYREALAWRVARAIAPALTRDEKMAVNAWQKYVDVLRTAEVPAANETQRPADEDPDWIKGR
jgi:hypothetical protein